MKNREMKTIIRHIDRLTRNLNARGRRRDASNDLSREQIDNIKATIKSRCALIEKQLIEIRRDFILGGIFEDIEKEDFENIKKIAQSSTSIINSQTIARFKEVIKLSEEAIKAQKKLAKQGINT